MEDDSDEDNTNDNDDINEVMSPFCKSIGHLPCVSHTSQLALRDGLKESNLAKKISNECATVVAFFRRSNYYSDKLRKATGGLSVVAAVATRRNSLLLMLRRLSSKNIRKVVIEILTKAREKKGRKQNVPSLTV